MLVNDTVRMAIKIALKNISGDIVVDLFLYTNSDSDVVTKAKFPNFLTNVYGIETNLPGNSENKRVNVMVDPYTRLVNVNCGEFNVHYKALNQIKIVVRPRTLIPLQNDLWIKIETEHDAYFDFKLEE